MKSINEVKMSIILILQVVIFGFLGCTKDTVPTPTPSTQNQKPSISLNSNTEYLGLSINGSILDSDGLVTKVKVDWGNDENEIFTNIDFANFEKEHLYTEAGVYNVLVSAFDNDGDSTIQAISIYVESKPIPTILQNIKGGMLKTSDKEFIILTLNMHTYQEQQQDEKLDLITELIGEMDIDFIALQECAQHKSSPVIQGIIRDDNMALIISNRLKTNYNVDYNFAWHWSHYGWDVWEEGVAVMSKHPVIYSENRYVSSSTSVNSITSRKVIYGSYQTTEGIFNLFSAHTHWRTSTTDEEQNNQIKKIQGMVSEKGLLSTVEGSFVAGDFNGNPTSNFPWSEGYKTMVNNGEYDDTFLDVYPDANNKPAKSIYHTVGGSFPGRIDYIFMKNNSKFEIIDSQIIFTSNVVGEVSDHYGVITKVRYVE